MQAHVTNQCRESSREVGKLAVRECAAHAFNVIRFCDMRC